MTTKMWIKVLPGAILLTACLCGCHRHGIGPEAAAPIVVRDKAPGIVNEVWEEPMADVVDVPPGLDPDGVYYRPGHQEVVEIRQGRWQYYKDKNQ